jgi:ATP-binding cassette, subfamily F, member 3
VLAGRARGATAASEGRGPRPDRRAEKRAEAEARQRRSELRKPLQAKLVSIETDLDQLSAEKRALDDWLASQEAYTDENRDRLKQTLATQADLTWRLARVEAAWLELHDALAKIED